MSFIASIDVRTLLGCQIVLTLVYAIVFCCMKYIYPYLRGAGSVALAFFAATIANILLLLSGSIPAFLSVVVSHCLLLSAFVLFYTGVLRFFKSPRKIRYAWALTVVASALTVYLVLSHDHTIALTYVIAISFFLVRGFIAVEIFRQAADRIFLKIFAYLMAGYAIFALNRIFFLLVYGALPNQRTAYVSCRPSRSSSVSPLPSSSASPSCSCSAATSSPSSKTSPNATCSAASSTAAVSSRSSTPNSSAPAAAATTSPSPSSTSTTSRPSTTTLAMQPATLPSATSSLPSPVACAHTTPRPLRRRRVSPDLSPHLLLRRPHRLPRIEQSVRELSIPGAGLPLTISIGLTQATPGEVAAPLLARADKALYNAKNAGRNCCRVLLHETDAERDLGRIILPSSPAISCSDSTYPP